MEEQSHSDIFEVEANADFLPGARVLLVTTDEPAVASSSPLIREQPGQAQSGIMNWGPMNNRPQEIIGLANSSPEILSLLDFYHTALYGGGIYYEVQNGTDSKGKPVYVEGFDAEVEDWMSFNQINDYYLESTVDFTWFNHAFAEMIRNKRGDKIVQITSQEAAFSRFGLQNDKGYSDKIYLNANWPNATITDKETIPVTALDPYNRYQVEFVKSLKANKFILPVNFPTPGKVIYQDAMWHSIFPSGWFEISRLIPVLRKALMQFQMTIKYVIEVPMSFWEKLAQDKGKVWKDLLPNEKKKLQTEIKKQINDFLTGADNAGKSFLTTFGWDATKGQKIPGITVTALDDKIKDGKYIEDGKEAGGHFIRSFGIPVTLIGPISSRDMGSGSGSDARVHMNIFNQRLSSRQDRLLNPLQFAANYNGWRKRMPGFRFKVRKFQIDTLDENHSTVNPLQAAA